MLIDHSAGGTGQLDHRIGHQFLPVAQVAVTRAGCRPAAGLEGKAIKRKRVSHSHQGFQAAETYPESTAEADAR